MFLLSRAGLRYEEKAISPGAQTERRGDAGPGESPPGGDTSPAHNLRVLMSVVVRAQITCTVTVGLTPPLDVS
jgi:hypothetical protein